MKKADILILTAILVCALIARLYAGLNSPVGDYHSSHQASTLSIANHFAQDGINLLYPRHNDAYNYQLGIENPEQYYFYEFPLYSGLIAIGSFLFPETPFEVIGRTITMISSLIVIGGLYVLIMLYYNRNAAIIAGLIFSVFPFFVFFSRVALSDMLAVALYILSLLLFSIFLTKERPVSIPWFMSSLFFYAISVLVKPGLALFIIPYIVFLFQKHKRIVIKAPELYLFPGLAFLPAIWWATYTSKMPEGTPFSYFISGNPDSFSLQQTLIPGNIFFQDVIYTHGHTYILGGLLTAFILISLLLKHKQGLAHWLLLSSLLYLLIFQFKHAEYEFYQTLILPAFALSAGLGCSRILDLKHRVSRIYTICIILAVCTFSYYISFVNTRPFYHVSDDSLQMAKVISTLTKPDERVITDTDGNTTILYLADREGATSPYREPDVLKEKGYAYLATRKEETQEAYEQDYGYEPVFENNIFHLYRL